MSVVGKTVSSFFALLAGSVSILGASAKESTSVGGQPATIDTLRVEAFLNDVCSKAPGAEFASAWLAHEEKYWDFYGPVYYRTEGFKAGRKQLSDELKDRRDEMCKYARTFAMIAPSMIQALAPRVKDLTGVEPALPLYFAAALQWTDGNGADFQGKRIYGNRQIAHLHGKACL